MKRREFITLVGGAAATWPLTARAQQAQRGPLVGWLSGSPASVITPQVVVFRERMVELGWRGGRDVAVDVRATAGNFAALDTEAAALVAAGAKLIITIGTPALTSVQRHTRTVPIVFINVSDPVGQHLIENLARPGGHATGLTNFEFSMSGKWLELLKEIAPSITHTVLISNPANAGSTQYIPSITAAGRARDVEVATAPVRDAPEIESAIELAAKRPSGSLIVLPDSLPNVHRALIVSLAERHRLPAIYAYREFPANGGLISYGLDVLNVYRQAANYVDKILRGAKPADLPVQAPNKFELVINLKTAKTLGIDVPLFLQQRADEVIE